MRDRDRSLRLLFKGGGIVFLGMIFDYGLSFLGKVAISRYLGSVEYGAVVLGIVLIMSLQQLCLVGMNNGVARYLPRFDEPGARKGVILTGGVICLGVALATAALVFVLAPTVAVDLFDDPAVTPVLQLFALCAPLAVLRQFAVGVSRGQSRTAPRVLIENIVDPISRIVLIALVVVLGVGMLGGALAYALPYVVGALLGAWYLWRHTPLRERANAIWMYRELAVFSAPLAISSSMMLIYINMDTFFLGYFATTSDVGVYNVVYTLASLLWVPLTAFGFLAMPILSGYDAEDDFETMETLYGSLTKWIFAASLPLALAFVLIPEPFIHATFGPEYVDGWLALAVLALGFTVHTLLGPNGKTIQSIGRTRVQMYDTIATALLNLGLNLVLIPRYGIVGAAIATTISYVFLNVLLSAQLYRSTGIQPLSWRFVPILLGATVLFILIMIILAPLTGNTLLYLVSVFITFSIAYTILLVLVAVDETELILLRSIEHRFEIDLERVKRIALLRTKL